MTRPPLYWILGRAGTSTMGMLPGGVCLNSNIFAGSVALVEVCALPSATL